MSKYRVVFVPYFPVFIPITGKFGPKKTGIWTVFMQYISGIAFQNKIFATVSKMIYFTNKGLKEGSIFPHF